MRVSGGNSDMKRFVWITIVVFGGGLAALMVASMLLQREVGRVPLGAKQDLRTVMRNVRHALEHWVPEMLAEHAVDVDGLSLSLTNWDHAHPDRQRKTLPPAEAYNRMFRTVEGGDAEAVRKYKSLLSALETFPSVTFTGMELEAASVTYEIRNDPAYVWMNAGFKPGEVGYVLDRFECQLDATAAGPIALTEGEGTLGLREAVDKLFDAIATMNTKAFRAVMVLDEKASDAEVLARLRGLRERVMGAGGKHSVELISRMVPTVASLPAGVKWVGFYVTGRVVGEFDEKRLWLRLHVTNETPVRILKFGVGGVKDPTPPPRADG